MLMQNANKLADTLNAIWLQYFGVCNEFEILFHKWNYFSDGIYLPNISDLQEDIKNLIINTDKIFMESKFDKRTQFRHSDFILPQNIFDIEKRFLTLSQY